MAITVLRTDSGNSEFQRLVALLDMDLARRNGESNDFFVPHNRIDHLRNVVLAMHNGQALACVAIKPFDEKRMEVKRMYVDENHRRQGLAALVLSEVEKWAGELGYSHCVLETGDQMPEAVGLYTRNGYKRIPNYGPYTDVDSSYCFEKAIV